MSLINQKENTSYNLLAPKPAISTVAVDIPAPITPAPVAIVPAPEPIVNEETSVAVEPVVEVTPEVTAAPITPTETIVPATVVATAAIQDAPPLAVEQAAEIIAVVDAIAPAIEATDSETTISTN